MAEPVLKPTPTQDENDRTAEGEHVIDHDHDGSAFEPGGADPASVPHIDSLAPTSGPLPQTFVSVSGRNFTIDSVIVFNGAPLSTAFVSATLVRAELASDAAGSYPVIVRGPAGDSNTALFTFTAARVAAGDDDARGRRRR